MRTNNIQSTTNNGFQSQGVFDDIMARPAPPHVNIGYWEMCNAQERYALLQEAAVAEGNAGNADNHHDGGHAWGGIAVGTGQGMLRHSSDIFTAFPGSLKQEYQFSISPVTKKGGASKPLIEHLDNNGIKHNGTDKKKLRPVPEGAMAKPAQGMSLGQLNNRNGAAAADAIAQRYKGDKNTKVQQNVMVDTPKGKRDVDIRVIKNQGLPTSEEIRIESKLGKQSLPGVAQGSNIRAQIEKDVSALDEHRAKSRVPHAVGRTLYRAGQFLRPVGLVLSGLEIRDAMKADGNRVGMHTASKVSSIAGGALGGAAGGAVGAMKGAAIGAAVGSVVPVVGTAIGAAVGGIVGAVTGGALGGLAGEAIASGAFKLATGAFSFIKNQVWGA